MSFTIGELVAPVEADTSEFSRSMGEIEKKGARTARSIGSQFDRAGKKISGIGKGMTMRATAPIVGGLIAITKGTKRLRTDLGKLDTAFTTTGFTSEQAKDSYHGLVGVLGESDRAIEASNHLAELADNQKQLDKWTTISTGVFAKFGDSLPIENLTESANETAKTGKVIGGLADALNWAGISEDEFNKKLEATSSEQERVALITDTLNGKYAEAAEKYRETNKGIIESNKASAKLGESLAKLGEMVAPIMTMITKKVTTLLEWFNNLGDGTKKTILIIAGIAAAIGPVLTALGLMASGLGVIIPMLPVLGGALVAIATGPIAIIIAAIAAAIAIGVLLYKNWDLIKEQAGALKDKVISVFKAIPKAVMSVIKNARGWGIDLIKDIANGIREAAGRFLEGAVNKIKGVLNKLNPFSRSSPSLVDNVRMGVKEISKAYEDMDIPDFHGFGSAGITPPSSGRQRLDIGGKIGIELSGQGIEHLNENQIADAVNSRLAQQISDGDRRLPNRVSVTPIK